MIRRFQTLAVLAAVLSVTALTGCKGNCRQLAEKLCKCAANTIEENNCLTQVANEEARIGPTSADETTCGTLLAQNQCDCNHLDDPAVKKACGLAR